MAPKPPPPDVVKKKLRRMAEDAAKSDPAHFAGRVQDAYWEIAEHLRGVPPETARATIAENVEGSLQAPGIASLGGSGGTSLETTRRPTRRLIPNAHA